MKHMIRLFFAFLSYYMGVDAFFYLLNRNAKRIVTFHNVLPEELFKADLTNGVSNSEDEFRFIIREIRKRFKVSVDEMDSKSATITFDDGFLNQYEIAGRILREEGGVPAIVFVAGEVLNNTDPYNTIVVEQLLHWTAYAPSGEYAFPYCRQQKLRLTDSNRVDAWVQYVRPAFAADNKVFGRNVLETLNAQYPIARILDGLPSEYRRLRLTGISASQIDELRSRGWKIGWHTKSHYPLRSLNEVEKRKEISPPKEFEEVVFSYPYGELLSVDMQSILIVKDCGYPCAVSNIINVHRRLGRYFMPRMSLPANKYLLHFRLSGAEFFLQTRRLLDVIT